jgi:hypothetical protein
MTNYKEVHDKIREACLRRPDLAQKDSYWKPEQRGQTAEELGLTGLKPYQGHCYVASFAFAALVPEATIHTNSDKGHYWNEVNGEIVDLTKEQFPKGFDYSDSRKVRRKFRPTKRVKELLEEVDDG